MTNSLCQECLILRQINWKEKKTKPGKFWWVFFWFDYFVFSKKYLWWIFKRILTCKRSVFCVKYWVGLRSSWRHKDFSCLLRRCEAASTSMSLFSTSAAAAFILVDVVAPLLLLLLWLLLLLKFLCTVEYWLLGLVLFSVSMDWLAWIVRLWLAWLTVDVLPTDSAFAVNFRSVE